MTQRRDDRRTPGSRRIRWLALALAVFACDDVVERSATERLAAEPPVAHDTADAATSDRQAGLDSVDVVFTRAEAPVTVRRPAAGGDPLRSALEALLAGPSRQERADSIESWFSEATEGSLRSVSVDTAGHVVVDFEDLRNTIPNAGSSTGSTLLLMELNGTVFQFPEVRSVEYRIEGSCQTFWAWLQYGCQTVTRDTA